MATQVTTEFTQPILKTSEEVKIKNAIHLWSSRLDAGYVYGDVWKKTLWALPHISLGGTHIALYCEGENGLTTLQIRDDSNAIVGEIAFSMAKGIKYLKTVPFSISRGNKMTIEIICEPNIGQSYILKNGIVLEVEESRDLGHATQVTSPGEWKQVQG